MKYSHPQAVYQWIHVDFSVKQVWCEWKWMGFAAVVHTEVLVKKQLGHWDQENTLPIFARVRAIALPSPPREIGTKNWMNVYIDNSSWYFFPSTFQIAIFLLPRIYCSLCCAPETQYLSLGQFTVLSLFPFMHPHPQGLFWNNYFFCVGGYIKIRLLQMGRWSAGCAHRLHPNQSVVTHARDLLQAFSPLGSLWCPLNLRTFFRTDIYACWSLRSCWVGEYKHCCLTVSVARCSVRQQLLLRGMSGLGQSWCPWDQPSPSPRAATSTHHKTRRTRNHPRYLFTSICTLQKDPKLYEEPCEALHLATSLV